MECQNKDLIPHGLRITHELHAFLQSENLQEDWKKSTKALERHFLKLLNKHYSDTLEELTTELSRIEEEEEKLTEDCTIERVLCQHAEITDENGKKLSSQREGMENKRRKKNRSSERGQGIGKANPRAPKTHKLQQSEVRQKRAPPTEKGHSRGYLQLQQRQPAARQNSQTSFRNPKTSETKSQTYDSEAIRQEPTRIHRKNCQSKEHFRNYFSKCSQQKTHTETKMEKESGSSKKTHCQPFLQGINDWRNTNTAQKNYHSSQKQARQTYLNYYKITNST